MHIRARAADCNKQVGDKTEGNNVIPQQLRHKITTQHPEWSRHPSRRWPLPGLLTSRLVQQHRYRRTNRDYLRGEKKIRAGPVIGSVCKTLTTVLSNQTRIDATRPGSGGGIPNGRTKYVLRLDARNLSLGLSLLLLLPLDFLRVTVEEHVDHDVPAIRCPGDRSAQTEDFAGEEPPDETDGMPGLVIGGDSNVDELQRGIGVAESNDRDVDV